MPVGAGELKAREPSAPVGAAVGAAVGPAVPRAKGSLSLASTLNPLPVGSIVGDMDPLALPKSPPREPAVGAGVVTEPV